MTESEFQRLVIDLAKWSGFAHYHTVDSRKSRPGFPDLVLVHITTGRLIFAELKSATGRIRVEQEMWLDLLRKRCEVYLWRPSDWDSGLIREVLSSNTTSACLTTLGNETHEDV